VFLHRIPGRYGSAAGNINKKVNLGVSWDTDFIINTWFGSNAIQHCNTASPTGIGLEMPVFQIMYETVNFYGKTKRNGVCKIELSYRTGLKGVTKS
jgi:hypothetical protein